MAYKAFHWAEFILIAAVLTFLILVLLSLAIRIFNAGGKTYGQILHERMELNGCMTLLIFLLICEIVRKLIGIQL